MPRPGGEADKLGNRYESLWTVDAALDLIDDAYLDLTVEAVGDEAAGVEFVRTTQSGVHEYHSIKRQHSKGNWTLARLKSEGILNDLIVKTGTDSCAVFSSGTSATEFEELIERAKASDSFEGFKKRIDESGRISGQFVEHIAPLCEDERAAWIALQRLCVRTTNEPQLIKNVERRVRSMFQTTTGEPINPRAVRLLIGEVLISPMGKRHDKHSVLDALKEQGYPRSRLAGETTVREHIQKLNRSYLKEVQTLFINQEEIVRDESTSAVAALLDQGKSAVIEGMAGSGKSCVLAQLIGRLNKQDIPCLVFRLDRLDSNDQRSQAVGSRLGLPKSPAITLGEFAGDQPSVLVVDQLDAISVVSARNQAAWTAFNELLEEADSYPNMRILFACRTVDLERDPRLRALVDDQERVERIPVGALDEEVIQSALTAAGLNPSSLHQKQMEILSTPLHLHLLLESANSGPVRFTSARDLFDAFWEHKGKAVSRRMGEEQRVWATVIGCLCKALSERETLVAPSYVLDDYSEALNILASENIVYIQDNSIRFFHEAFFDYAFARAFVHSNKNLVKWLINDEQHLFRRSQVRQVLEFLRGHEADRTRYRQTLRGILGHSQIRFHIKKLVLDWLGELPDPTPNEWHIVEGLSDELGEHLWGIISNSVPWFDTLQGMGQWQEWLEADDDQINHTLGLLRMPDVLNTRSALIVGLVRANSDASEAWKERLQRLTGGGNSYTSPEMRDFIVELIGDGTLDQVRPEFAGNDDWWFTWYGLGTKQPEFAIRILGAWFDRQIARAEALGQPDPFADHLGLVAYSQTSGDLIRECAEAAPLQFVRELFPRLARFDLGVPKEWIAAPGGGRKPDEQLRDAIMDAMCTVAGEHPIVLDAIIEAEPHGKSKWMSALLLQAWSANPEAYADRIVRFILASPDQRLTIGYDISEGGTDSFAAVSRIAIAKASSRCSDESFANLERAILSLRPDWETRSRAVGRTVLPLLRVLDETRFSASACQRIQELERRFPDAPERGVPQPPAESELDGGWVSSPIPQKVQPRMTDGQWLRAMEKYPNVGPNFTEGAISGGALELSRDLADLTKDDPARFARLADRMNATLHPYYFEAILRGLTNGKGSDRPGTLDQVCSVLRRIADIKVAVSEQVLANAIGALANEDVPQDIVCTLCGIAGNATDPENDSWREPSAHLPWEKPPDPDPVEGPINQAINSVRGTAAWSIARLLFANTDRWYMLKPTVEQLITDPVLAVRSVAVRCLRAILDTHREDSFDGFRQLIDGADSILGSKEIEWFVHYAMFRDYAAMRPTLMKMLQSSEPAVMQVGAGQMALAGLWMDEARDDTDLVLSMGATERAAAADIYARNVSNATVGSACENRLKTLFWDEDNTVRQSAATCWRALKPDELAKRGSLLGAFMESINSDVDVFILIHKLEQSRERLPSEVCKLAERVVKAYGPKGADFRLRKAGAVYGLAPLIIRLHEETEDPELRRRVLDVIDDMLRMGFMGMNDQLEKHYTRS